jgi:hypothetical protein
MLRYHNQDQQKGARKMFASKKWLGLLSALLIVVIITTGCRGVRRQVGATPTPAAGASTTTKGWSLIPINVTKSAAGDLHVDLAARNDSGAWSSMAAAEKPASLTTKDGKNVSCDTVQVSTGGHYLPPGFQVRGYTLKGNKTQTLYVECKGAEPSSGSRLSIPYSFVTGEYDYYAQDKTKVEAQFDVDLDKTSSNLTYPGTLSSGVKAQPITDPILALNKCTLANTSVARTGDTISFQWKVSNPGEYDTKVHIGEPPVLGSDGILYGVRVSPDIVDQPFAPPAAAAEFKTQVSVPKDVTGLYLLLSVEQSRERLFVNYLIDLTGLK